MYSGVYTYQSHFGTFIYRFSFFFVPYRFFFFFFFLKKSFHQVYETIDLVTIWVCFSLL